MTLGAIQVCCTNRKITLRHFNFTFSTLIKEKCSKTLIGEVTENVTVDRKTIPTLDLKLV